MTQADTQTDVGAAHFLTLQFLAWIAESPRSYGDAMDAWRTSCPRLTIWEDAMRDGLFETVKGNGAMRDAALALTPRGQALLATTTANNGAKKNPRRGAARISV